jgi:outer membrane protein OmpA-like peptidoglycan-associated protein
MKKTCPIILVIALFATGCTKVIRNPEPEGAMQASRETTEEVASQETNEQMPAAGAAAAGAGASTEMASNQVANMAESLSDELHFETNSSKLKPEAVSKLKEFAAVLAESPDSHVTIQGFTDSTGSSKRNNQLAQQRAKAVQSVLAQNGVSQDQLVTEALGTQNPVSENTTSEGRAQNRRVEILIG